ncbi:hypothetical protein EDC04DRAFT_304093 [Pisolithus marmoratus]|nr:hypothetical protein EDC04DRAFT_304093 [Pisolithus marmoratus]
MHLQRLSVVVCEGASDFKFLYDLDCSIKEKINTICKETYHATVLQRLLIVPYSDTRQSRESMLRLQVYQGTYLLPNPSICACWHSTVWIGGLFVHDASLEERRTSLG